MTRHRTLSCIARRRSLTTILATLAASFVLAPGAHAAPVPVDSAPCPDQICFWDGARFTVAVASYYVDTNNCINIIPSLNNKTTAIVNKSSREYYVYDGAGCASYMAKIFARTANDNIGSGNNDRISSFKRVP
jgi:hypothetical protein